MSIGPQVRFPVRFPRALLRRRVGDDLPRRLSHRPADPHRHRRRRHPPYADQRAGLYDGIPEADYDRFTVDWMDAARTRSHRPARCSSTFGNTSVTVRYPTTSTGPASPSGPPDGSNATSCYGSTRWPTARTSRPTSPFMGAHPVVLQGSPAHVLPEGEREADHRLGFIGGRATARWTSGDVDRLTAGDARGLDYCAVSVRIARMASIPGRVPGEGRRLDDANRHRRRRHRLRSVHGQRHDTRRRQVLRPPVDRCRARGAMVRDRCPPSRPRCPRPGDGVATLMGAQSDSGGCHPCCQGGSKAMPLSSDRSPDTPRRRDGTAVRQQQCSNNEARNKSMLKQSRINFLMCTQTGTTLRH